MGKSKKRPENHGKRAQQPDSQINRRRFLAGTAGIVAAGFVAGFWANRLQKTSDSGLQANPLGPVDLSKLPRYEMRETLPPGLFMGSVAAAYTVAKRTPALLDRLYCYCRCKENFGHKSLLSCFVDRHAST